MTTTATQRIDDSVLDVMVAEDPNEPGRHYARLVATGHHVWPILATLRRTKSNIAETAAEWGLSEDEVHAAQRYYERNRDIFDAFFLLQQEEEDAFDRR